MELLGVYSYHVDETVIKMKLHSLSKIAVILFCLAIETKEETSTM
jgi:hypothetical protein